MAEVILVTGGARSGKSALALDLAQGFARRVFVATAQAFDDEMRERIARHREERGAEWETIEAPLELIAAIREADDPSAAIVVDCLTVWLGNLMHRDPDMDEEAGALDGLVEALDQSGAARIVLITNEVGMGIVPENALARRYRDIAGRLSQRIAAVADRVLLAVCGQVVAVKGEPPGGPYA